LIAELVDALVEMRRQSEEGIPMCPLTDQAAREALEVARERLKMSETPTTEADTIGELFEDAQTEDPALREQARKDFWHRLSVEKQAKRARRFVRTADARAFVRQIYPQAKAEAAAIGWVIARHPRQRRGHDSVASSSQGDAWRDEAHRLIQVLRMATDNHRAIRESLPYITDEEAIAARVRLGVRQRIAETRAWRRAVTQRIWQVVIGLLSRQIRELSDLAIKEARGDIYTTHYPHYHQMVTQPGYYHGYMMACDAIERYIRSTNNLSRGSIGAALYRERLIKSGRHEAIP
jgi:hypothetical protein